MIATRPAVDEAPARGGLARARAAGRRALASPSSRSIASPGAAPTVPPRTLARRLRARRGSGSSGDVRRVARRTVPVPVTTSVSSAGCVVERRSSHDGAHAGDAQPLQLVAIEPV